MSEKEKADYDADCIDAIKNGEAYLEDPLFVNLRSSASGIALDSQTLSNETGFAGLTQSPSTNSSNVLRSTTLPSGNLATSRSMDNPSKDIINAGGAGLNVEAKSIRRKSRRMTALFSRDKNGMTREMKSCKA